VGIPLLAGIMFRGDEIDVENQVLVVVMEGMCLVGLSTELSNFVARRYL
jgi:hypothetical protein